MPSTSSAPSFSIGLFRVILAAVLGSSLLLWCQGPSPQLSPRELFYREQAPDHTQRATGVALKKHVGDKDAAASPKTPNGSAMPSGSLEEEKTKGATLVSAETSAATTAGPEVSHLGLRYSLLLVDKTTGDAKPVSSNQTFDQGECFGLEFQSNRSGYLYVFNLGSSGAWKPLLPTEEMPEEGNFVPAFTTTRVPSSHCYRISGPPGAERLFVVLSRNPQDVKELNRSIRNGPSGEPGQSQPQEPSGGLTTLAANLNQAIQRFASLKGRDLEIQEVGGTKDSSEPVPAVYIVHTSATPSDKVTTEIQITHR